MAILFSLKYDAIYILPSEIPQIGIEKWTAIQSLVFLKEHANLSVSMKLLGSVSLSVCTFYCDFVFKHFSLLDQGEKILHLTFVKNFFLQLKNSNIEKKSTKEIESWQKHLQNLKFLPDNGNIKYYTASQFFDPKEEVFEVMLDNEKFPQEPYIDPIWHELPV